MMAERSLNTADKHLVNTIKKRIAACLRHNRKRGIVGNGGGAGESSGLGDCGLASERRLYISQDRFGRHASVV